MKEFLIRAAKRIGLVDYTPIEQVALDTYVGEPVAVEQDMGRGGPNIHSILEELCMKAGPTAVMPYAKRRQLLATGGVKIVLNNSDEVRILTNRECHQALRESQQSQRCY